MTSIEAVAALSAIAAAPTVNAAGRVVPASSMSAAATISSAGPAAAPVRSFLHSVPVASSYEAAGAKPAALSVTVRNPDDPMLSRTISNVVGLNADPRLMQLRAYYFVLNTPAAASRATANQDPINAVSSASAAAATAGDASSSGGSQTLGYTNTGHESAPASESHLLGTA